MKDAELADLTDALRALLSGIQEVPLAPAILERAGGPFPAVIGTLDAIHLATALLWTQKAGEPLLFSTHDIQLAVAARTCGFEVITAS